MMMRDATTRSHISEVDVAADVAGAGAFPLGSPAAMAVRPSAVSISVEDPSRPGLNVIRGVVRDLEPRGDVVRVRGAIAGGATIAADVLPSVVVDLDLAEEGVVYFAFEPAATTVYPGV
jgi:molybdate transport system ATP-binding protein